MSGEESKYTEESKYKEESKQSEGVTLIFTIGRMNPPTSGHMGLVKKMIEKAIELEEKGEKTQVAVILSHSHEKDILKNPLQCKDEKRSLVSDMIKELKKQMIKEKNEENKKYIENIEPTIMCMDDEKVPNMFSSIGSLVRKYTPNQMILYIGEDRDESFSGIKKYYENIILETIKRPEDAMSATEMRGYASSGNKDKFVEKMLPTGLDEERIEKLYKKLHYVLTDPNNQPKSKAKSTATSTRKRKVIEEKIEGGRKTKAKSNKRRIVKTKKNKKSLRRRRR
jgi:hypothetical protein